MAAANAASKKHVFKAGGKQYESRCSGYSCNCKRSRPKAAGTPDTARRIRGSGFNTQPPEGGWIGLLQEATGKGVSTHSRPLVVGNRFNTQPLTRYQGLFVACSLCQIGCFAKTRNVSKLLWLAQ